MNNSRPKAIFLSLLLHAALGAFVVLFSFFHSRAKPQSPPLFELVAGPGDNYAALEAPLGTDSAADAPPIRFDLPEPAPLPEPQPIFEEPPPAPEPPPPLEPAREVIPAAPPPAPVPPPRETPRPRPTPAPTPKPPRPEPKPMTKEEFDKLHGNKPNPTAARPRAPRPAPRVRQIDTRGIVGGSPRVSAGAGGTALSRAEGDLLDAYIALLRQRLRAAHNKPAGLSDLLQTTIRFAIAADGTLSNLRITKSSGSREFDESVLAAFRKVRSIGPTPNGKGDTWELTFKLTDAN